MSEDNSTMAMAARREMLEREAQQWLLRLTSGRATAADAVALKDWCAQSKSHAEAFAEANILWESLGVPAQRVAKSDALAEVNSGRAIAVRRRAILGGAAAAAAAAVGYLVLRPPLELWPSAYELAADYRTRTGERRRVYGENGVSINLNTRSSLNVRAGRAQRFELVSGEAAIETAEKLAAPLTVAAAGGRVYTVDAQFNLRCDGLRAIVTCHRGSVSVEYSGQSTMLGEGRQISYANGAMDTASSVDAAVVMAWRQGQLVFRQTPLSQVVEEVNRYRSGRIILMNEKLGRRLVEARIPLDAIDELIGLVRRAYGAEVTALPGGILVLS